MLPKAQLLKVENFHHAVSQPPNYGIVQSARVDGSRKSYERHLPVGDTLPRLTSGQHVDFYGQYEEGSAEETEFNPVKEDIRAMPLHDRGGHNQPITVAVDMADYDYEDEEENMMMAHTLRQSEQMNTLNQQARDMLMEEPSTINAPHNLNLRPSKKLRASLTK